MKTNYLYKDTFAVIGKAGTGPAHNPMEWISPLWEEANTNYLEIAHLVQQNEAGIPSLWGAMNDVNECNKRWDDTGKYMASGEVDINAIAPEGWTKWIIPSQTYLVVSCTMESYLEIFNRITHDPKIEIVGTVHERYPEPTNPNSVELYFPVAEGKLFCQSCYMPMLKTEDFGTEKDGVLSLDYCCHCYNAGEFTDHMTLDEAVEANLPWWRDGCKDDDEARALILSTFATLKRWSKA